MLKLHVGEVENNTCFTFRIDDPLNIRPVSKLLQERIDDGLWDGVDVKMSVLDD